MSQENVEIVRRCYAALDRRDWEGLWREAHPDFELRTQLQGSRLGPDEAQAFIEDQFAAFESWVVAPERLFESDDQVVAFVVIRSRPRGSSARDHDQDRTRLDPPGWDGPDNRDLPPTREGPRSRRAVGVGDVAGERRTDEADVRTLECRGAGGLTRRSSIPR